MSNDERAAAQLNRLTAEFPAFSIVLESTADNAIRFVARNRHPDVHPRMVITPDVAELRAALSASGAAAGLMAPCHDIPAAVVRAVGGRGQ